MLPGLLLCLLLAASPQQPAPTEPPATVVARAQLHDRTGWNLFTQRDYDAALREFAAALPINPGYADALYGMGKTYMALQRHDMAAAAFERCREVYANTGANPDELRMVRNRERESRLRDLRTEVFNLQNTPQPETNENLARMIQGLQEQIRALEGQREPGPVMELSASQIPAFVSFSLGSAYFHLNRLGDAERMFREALAAQARFGEARSNLALVLLVTARPREAQQQVALAEESGFTVNPELKRRIRTALKDLQQ